MLQKPKCPVIALEEHYWDRELAAQFVGIEAMRDPELLKRLYDLGELRIKEMDEAGIDVQILSHGAPSTQKRHGKPRTLKPQPPPGETSRWLPRSVAARHIGVPRLVRRP